MYYYFTPAAANKYEKKLKRKQIIRHAYSSYPIWCMVCRVFARSFFHHILILGLWHLAFFRFVFFFFFFCVVAILGTFVVWLRSLLLNVFGFILFHFYIVLYTLRRILYKVNSARSEEEQQFYAQINPKSIMWKFKSLKLLLGLCIRVYLCVCLLLFNNSFDICCQWQTSGKESSEEIHWATVFSCHQFNGKKCAFISCIGYVYYRLQGKNLYLYSSERKTFGTNIRRNK